MDWQFWTPVLEFHNVVYLCTIRQGGDEYVLKLYQFIYMFSITDTPLIAGIMISSAVVESLFSKYGYTRSKARSSMTDNTAAAILSTHELDDLIGNVEKPFSSTFSLRGAALSDRIDWV